MTVSEKITAKVETAKALLAAGFTTKAAQNEALAALSCAAGLIKDIYQDAFLAINRELKGYVSYERRDWYYDMPALHVWKEKHVVIANELYPELAALAALMTELVALRLDIKAAPVVKAPSKAAVRAVVLQTGPRKGNAEILAGEMQDVLVDAVTACVNSGTRLIEHVKERLADQGMSLKAAFTDRDAQGIAIRLTNSKDRLNFDSRVFSDELESHHLELCKRSAEDSFAGFVAKMVLKLGDKEIKSVQCVGRIWDRCTVTIKCTNGETVTMRTQIIINCSKHGKLFNQWPTRISKAA